MSKQVSDSQWLNFRKLIGDANDSFGQDVVTWKQAIDAVPRYFEDNLISGFTDIELKCLMGFNTFRTWPTTKHTPGGELDEENMILMINKDYLSNLGYLTAEGYLNYSAEKDRFIHRGLRYTAEGDTFFSQAFNDPLHIVILLKRDEVPTGEDRIIKT
jgi:hypothetical protein